MIRILIIEFILSGVIGAVIFRLAWAFTKKRKTSWGIVLIIAAIILIFASGSLDVSLIQEYGGKLPTTHSLSPVAVNLLRCLGLIIGAWLASIAVAKREKMGLEDEPPFKDFP